MDTIIRTGFKLATAVTGNGTTTGNPWTDPRNLLLTDGDVAESNPNNAASDVTVGNFNSNLPIGAVPVGIEIKVIGYRGAETSPPITLTPYLVDDTAGPSAYYPYVTPYTGLTPESEEHILGTPNYMFGQILTVDQVNNAKIQLVANGDMYIDAVLMDVYYYVPEAITPPATTGEVCVDCNSPIQAPSFELALPFLATDTKCYLKSFSYANGLPIIYEDLGSCGGYLDLVFDEGKRKSQGNNNFMENAQTAIWTVLTPYLVEVDFVDLSHRGLGFHTPYDHDDALLSDHDANSKVIISNNGPYEGQRLHKCQIGAIVSAPVTVQDEGATIVTGVETFNFIGPDVQAEVDGTDPKKVNVTILSSVTNTFPDIEDVNQASTGAGIASELTFAVTISDANYLRAWLTSDNIPTDGVAFDGVPMTLVGRVTNGPANLKAELYELVNPHAGTHDMVVGMTSSCHFSAGAIGFTGADVSSPTDGVSAGAIGSGTAPSDHLTTSSQNTVVMDVVGAVNNATTFAQAAPWAVRSHISAAARPGASSTRKVLVPADVTDAYSISPTGAWAIILAGVRGAPVAPGGVDSVTGLAVDNADPANPVILPYVQATPSDADPGALDAKLLIHSSDSTVSVVRTVTNPGANEVIDYNLKVTPSAGNAKVAVNGTDTTPDFLAAKVAFTSADSTVVIVPSVTSPGGDEVLSFDLSAPGGGGSTGVFPQRVALDGVSVKGAIFSTTSDTDGTLYAYGSAAPFYARYNLDPGTGKYYIADIAGPLSFEPATSTHIGLAVLGGFVYAAFKDQFSGVFKLIRIDKANLASQTAMTISGTAPSVASAFKAMYTDGTSLYIASTGTTWYRFTISGTTATNAATVTQIASVIAALCTDGTNVYLTDDSSPAFSVGTIYKTTVTGGGATSIARPNIFSIEQNNVMGGFAVIDSTRLYVVNEYTVAGLAAVANVVSVAGNSLMLEPVTKPV